MFIESIQSVSNLPYGIQRWTWLSQTEPNQTNMCRHCKVYITPKTNIIVVVLVIRKLCVSIKFDFKLDHHSKVTCEKIFQLSSFKWKFLQVLIGQQYCDGEFWAQSGRARFCTPICKLIYRTQSKFTYWNYFKDEMKPYMVCVESSDPSIANTWQNLFIFTWLWLCD